MLASFLGSRRGGKGGGFRAGLGRLVRYCSNLQEIGSKICYAHSQSASGPRSLQESRRSWPNFVSNFVGSATPTDSVSLFNKGVQKQPNRTASAVLVPMWFGDMNSVGRRQQPRASELSVLKEMRKVLRRKECQKGPEIKVLDVHLFSHFYWMFTWLSCLIQPNLGPCLLPGAGIFPSLTLILQISHTIDKHTSTLE